MLAFSYKVKNRVIIAPRTFSPQYMPKESEMVGSQKHLITNFYCAFHTYVTMWLFLLSKAYPNTGLLLLMCTQQWNSCTCCSIDVGLKQAEQREPDAKWCMLYNLMHINTQNRQNYRAEHRLGLCQLGGQLKSKCYRRQSFFWRWEKCVKLDSGAER